MRHLLLLSTALLFSIQLFAIKASVEIYRFMSDDKPYVEVNYRVLAESLSSDALQAIQQHEVQSTILIKQGEEIVNFSKNLLTYQGASDLLDVQRFALSAGDYMVSLELSDPNGNSPSFKVEKSISIAYDQKPSFSDISILATAKSESVESPLVKNGIYMEPLPYGVLEEPNNTMLTYCELYNFNTQPEDKYFIEYTVVQGYDDNPGAVELKKYKRIKSGEESVHLLNMDVSSLPSGAYHFMMILRDATKAELARKSANFIRTNHSADVAQLSRRSKAYETSFVHDIASDSLNYYLQAVSPVAQEPLRSALDEAFSSDDETTKRLYLHNYWKKQSPNSAEAMCKAYMKVARVVDDQFFNGTSYGFDTDMGYIFLRYGKPDDRMVVDDEPSALPYQIWRYNHIAATGEYNVKFLFYAPTLNHRDFRLLHSSCRVELQNPSWEAELYKKLTDDLVNNRDGSTSVKDGMGKRARDNWTDF